MFRVGVIGLGFIGRIHLQSYLADPRCRLTAAADRRLDMIRRAPAGNFSTELPEGFSLDDLTLTDDAGPIIESTELDAISICAPSAVHADLAVAALRHGKHVLVEKPLALTHADALKIVAEAARHPDLICMPAMCMRFWPGWDWLKQTIDELHYGEVRSAVFTRLGTTPTWGDGHYGDPAQSGGAILDLHIHDVDFIRFCFGDPVDVVARGSPGPRGGVDHVVSLYRFDDGPPLVAAEGGWMRDGGFGFSMTYRVQFDRATACYTFGRKQPLVVHGTDGDSTPVELAGRTGYAREISHFLDCIEQGRTSDVVTIDDGVEAVRLIECERRSVETGAAVAFGPQQ